MTERRWAVRSARLVAWLGLLPFYAAPPVALVDHRLGAYVFLAGVVGQLTTHRVAAIVGLGLVLRQRSVMWPYGLALGLSLTGLVLALRESDAGGVLLIAGLLIQVGTDFAIGLRRYRETMRRPWPQVAPIVDDDDW